MAVKKDMATTGSACYCPKLETVCWRDAGLSLLLSYSPVNHAVCLLAEGMLVLRT
ncbi:hypothetical protein M440DRAFT_1398008 [Trichoderma longibrachiatum ATCC 18648]|uniref:Uncharacterized protein n=1 Tax=Trichoderma longibrachiatum ATCC 18648 TaxID=983965 RepID=A0A2T4CGC8_TRILO|nr:hypothetical protein M440DRAFT_1398008 [Trichoderma longibrachiatum ATCC 18648]